VISIAECREQYDRLINAFGSTIFGEDRFRLLWTRSCDLDPSWLVKTVDKIIVAGNPRVNFDELISSEKKRVASLISTDSVVSALEALSMNQTTAEFERVLRLFGATNLRDAVENCKNYKMYEFNMAELEEVGPLLCKELGIE
jgi:hypothetical protein